MTLTYRALADDHFLENYTTVQAIAQVTSASIQVRYLPTTRPIFKQDPTLQLQQYWQQTGQSRCPTSRKVNL